MIWRPIGGEMPDTGLMCFWDGRDFSHRAQP
jgi:hypothetical protein